MRMLARVLAAVLASTAVVSAQGVKSAPAKSSGRSVPRISDVLLERIQEAARAGSTYAFLGLSEFEDGSLRLSVRSNRSLIAFNTAKATESGGRYRPSADLRQDLVLVHCGDSDLGDKFDCTSVTVKRLDGRRVPPLSYTAGRNAYRNAMGATWTVREVGATYLPRDLVNGFTVDYADDGGNEWTMTVTAADFAEKLMMFDDASPAPSAPATGPIPSPSM